MSDLAGTSGLNSVAGMGALSAAVSLSKLRLEGTKLAVTGISASLMPPASDGASIVALAQQQESIHDYLDKITKGAGHLDQLSRAMQSHISTSVAEDEIAAMQFNAT